MGLPGPKIGRDWRVVGRGAQRALLDLDPLGLGLQILGGLGLHRERLQKRRIGQPIDGGIEPLHLLHDVRQLGVARTVAPFRNHEDDPAPPGRTLFQHQERLTHGIQHVGVIAFLAQHAERVNHEIRVRR